MSAFVDGNRERFGVEPICREIETSASAYRARRARSPSARSLRDAWLLNQIRRVHDGSDGIYGQLKIWDELNDEGIAVARCTVERLMRANGIEGCRNGKVQVTTRPGPTPVAADDLVRRDFTADRPDAVWLSDFTYIRTREGWSYLAVVLDIYTRRIVGWQLQSHMRQSLVTDAFEMANASRQYHADGLIAHSDNGSQYNILRVHRATEAGRNRAEQGSHGDRVGQRHGRVHHVHAQARAHQALHVEDAPGPRARTGDLHRLVQRPPQAPLTEGRSEREDQAADAASGPRPIQSGSRCVSRGIHVIEPTWNPGRSRNRRLSRQVGRSELAPAPSRFIPYKDAPFRLSLCEDL